MKDNAADELNPVGAHAQDTIRSFPNGGKGFRQNVIQRLALLETALEHIGLTFQLSLAHGLVGVTQSFDFIHGGRDGLDLTLGVGTKKLVHGICK